MKLLEERVNRFITQACNKFDNVNRDISWYIRGGRRFFGLYTQELLASHKWCFIVSCNNSGSSLLQAILENSGQVSTMPHEGQRYTTTLVKAHRRGHERVWSEFLDDLRLTEINSSDYLPRLVHDWLYVLKFPIKKIIIEKTTANSVRMRWLQNAFPNSYFIGLIRNGYAVTEGIHRKGKKSMSRGARHWNLVNKIMLEDANKIRNFLELRYEDLVEDAEETSNKLGKFLNIDSSMIYEAMKGKFDFQTIKGKDQQSINNMNMKSIDRLSQADIKLIEKEADEMLTYLSYKINS